MQKQVATVRSLLIQIANGDILIPSAVVAEIVSYKLPQPLDNQPEWLSGAVEWRNQRVPIVNLSQLMDLPKQADIQLSEKDLRLVVLYGLESIQVMPFYGFVAADVPRVLAVTEGSLENPSLEARKSAIFRVSVTPDSIAWLPDLTHIENLLRKSPVLAQLKI